MTIKEIIDRREVELDEIVFDVHVRGCTYEESPAQEICKRRQNEIKAYQAETIRLVLGGVRDWVSENEYCSQCCSPKKHCPEWGKNASAIDTKDFLALLTQELKDLNK